MTTWKHSLPGVTLTINAEALSRQLKNIGEAPVNAAAAEGAEIAAGKVASGTRRFVGFAPARMFHLREDNQVKSALSKKLSIPVALIFNNSKWALNDEVGRAGRAGGRPLGSAFDELRNRSGWRGIRRAAK